MAAISAAFAVPAHAAPSAGAGSPQATASARSSLLWATVNSCLSVGNPREMGVRASMPGNGLRQRMYMRFRAQYWSPSKRGWRAVRGSGRSPWLYAGPARHRSRQAGWTFTFKRPRGGFVYTMRSMVDFQWRAKRRKRSRGRIYPRFVLKAQRSRPARWVVVQRRRTVTRAGVAGVVGGDPPGTSQAACLIF